MNHLLITGRLGKDAINIGTDNDPVYRFPLANTEAVYNANKELIRKRTTWIDCTYPDPTRKLWGEFQKWKTGVLILVEGLMHTEGLSRPGNVSLLVSNYRYVREYQDGHYEDI